MMKSPPLYNRTTQFLPKT